MDWSWPTWFISVGAVIISGLIAWLEGNWSRRPALGMGFVNHGGMWGDLVLLPIANATIVPHLGVGPWILLAIATTTVASLLVHRHWYHAARGETPGGIRPAMHRHTPPHKVRAVGAPSRGRRCSSFKYGPDILSRRAFHPKAQSPRVGGPGLPTGRLAALDARRAFHHGLQRGGGAGDHVWPARIHGTWARDLSWSGWAHVVYVVGELTLIAGFLIYDAPPAAVLLVAGVFTIHVPLGLLQPRYFLTGHIATVSEQPLLAPLMLALVGAIIFKI